MAAQTLLLFLGAHFAKLLLLSLCAFSDELFLPLLQSLLSSGGSARPGLLLTLLPASSPR